MDDKRELLREWVRAEIWAEIAHLDRDADGYAASTRDEKREAETLWARVRDELLKAWDGKENDDD